MNRLAIIRSIMKKVVAINIETAYIFHNATNTTENEMNITIQTNADFTPSGKRSVRIVRHARSGKKIAQSIRLYVAGKIYATLPITIENMKMVEEWYAA